MGLLDGLKSALGLKAEADATRDADPEDLFGMSTAYITMEAELGFAPTGEAALCFSEVDSSDFRDTVAEVREILTVAEADTGTVADFREDEYGSQWVVVEADDFEDLVTSVHFAADTMHEAGFGSRLLAAVFPFREASTGDAVYWIYSFRRGRFYPFAPAGAHDRDSSAEFKLESVLDGELAVEEDKSYWYPLWPEGDAHPWGPSFAATREHEPAG